MRQRGDWFDHRMADGARHFAEVDGRPAGVIRQRLVETPGVVVTEFLDSVTETWIDFDYAGHAFTAHNPFNDWWLFVRDPACPEAILRDVVRLLA